jgi:D-sedoheptulose 7-phosphate isomerase
MESIKEALREAARLTALLSDSKELVNFIKEFSGLAAGVLSAGGKVLICGNGGSYADAMHFAEEFTGRFRQSRRALPVLALGDGAHLTCVANDFGFDEVFSRSVEALGAAGDLLIVLTTSGNSRNLMRAIETAKRAGMRTISMTGRSGGELLGKSDIEYLVPGTTSDRIQELQMLILHIVIEQVERQLFLENYN